MTWSYLAITGVSSSIGWCCVEAPGICGGGSIGSVKAGGGGVACKASSSGWAAVAETVSVSETLLSSDPSLGRITWAPKVGVWTFSLLSVTA